MANVPATTAVAENLIETQPAQGNIAAGGKPQNVELLAGFGRLDLLRQFGLMIGLMASVAIGFAVVVWSQGGDYQPVYGNMQGYNTSAIMETLELEAIDYRVEPNSGVILVPANDVARIRLRLAAAGVTRYDGTGYELLDESQALGTSQYMEANRIKRSQEGELQRTITNFRNVQSARVHIAIPERSVFVRASRKPTASVFLIMNGGASLSDTQVDAIASLVAASVPELVAEDVTIVDQRGSLLSRRQGNSALDVADQQFEYVRKFEQTLVDRVGGILRPIVGLDGFQAEITADIDFTHIEQADEVYDPATRAIRSEQTQFEQKGGGSTVGGTAGSLSIMAPGEASLESGAGGAVGNLAVNGNSNQQATRYYELDRTISYTNHDPVSIRRLSVAVVLDNRRAPASAEGEAAGATIAWSEAELVQITALVSNAVGIDAARGDSITVINNSFARVLEIPVTIIPIWQQAWLQTLIKQVAGGIFVLLMVLGVLRPVMKNLASVNTQSRQLALAATQGNFANLDTVEQAMVDQNAKLAGSRGGMLPSADAGYEQQLDTVKGLATEDPARVAQVVKQWVGDDAEQ